MHMNCENLAFLSYMLRAMVPGVEMPLLLPSLTNHVRVTHFPKHC